MSTFGSLTEKILLSYAFSLYKHLSIEIRLISSIDIELIWISMRLFYLRAGHFCLNSSIISLHTNRDSLVSSSIRSFVFFWNKNSLKCR
jgi:hypothetical protein